MPGLRWRRWQWREVDDLSSILVLEVIALAGAWMRIVDYQVGCQGGCRAGVHLILKFLLRHNRNII